MTSRILHGRRAGFTLIEVLVVSGISILLLTMGAMIYQSCLHVYQNSQGATEVFETAKFINGDVRAYLSQAVPLKGNWINPICKGISGCTGANAASGSTIDDNYLNSLTMDGPQKQSLYARDTDHDLYFSGAQYSKAQFSGATEWKSSLGYRMLSNYPSGSAYDYDYRSWHGVHATYPGLRGWWLPAFFGLRNAVAGEDGVTSDVVRSANDIMAGAWGWPRPDYRLWADADKLAGGSAALDRGGCVSCWWYAEERAFNSPYTLALDNANILLVSVKFSMKDDGQSQRTQLSVLRHQIVGFDTPTHGLVRADHSYGNLLRAIRIDPVYMLAAGSLVSSRSPGSVDQAFVDIDSTVGWALDGGGPVGAAGDLANGNRFPCAFDVWFRLRNPRNMQNYTFASRVFQYANPQ
ncbi:MAG: hypothetical protein M5U26_20725 [Planctomycetota bacterium]|nr:hypothetical protein [Planctomycetota bacterium]